MLFILLLRTLSTCYLYPRLHTHTPHYTLSLHSACQLMLPYEHMLSSFTLPTHVTLYPTNTCYPIPYQHMLPYTLPAHVTLYPTSTCYPIPYQHMLPYTLPAHVTLYPTSTCYPIPYQHMLPYTLPAHVTLYPSYQHMLFQHIYPYPTNMLPHYPTNACYPNTFTPTLYQHMLPLYSTNTCYPNTFTPTLPTHVTPTHLPLPYQHMLPQHIYPYPTNTCYPLYTLQTHVTPFIPYQHMLPLYPTPPLPYQHNKVPLYPTIIYSIIIKLYCKFKVCEI